MITPIFFDHNSFTILHQNIAGLFSKLDILKVALEELKNRKLDIQVLCLSETFIQCGDEVILKLPNHKVAAYFSRCNIKRGGSMILVNKELDFKIINICKELSISETFECCGVEIPLYKLIIINIYRTPDSNVNVFLKN